MCVFTSGVTEFLFSLLAVRIKAATKVDITIRDTTDMKAATPITEYRPGRKNNTCTFVKVLNWVVLSLLMTTVL